MIDFARLTLIHSGASPHLLVGVMLEKVCKDEVLMMFHFFLIELEVPLPRNTPTFKKKDGDDDILVAY
jgi:hypothetical protein